MAFILARNGMAQDNIQKKKIADWTAANQLLYSHTELIKTEIGFSPLFHGPADDYSTLNTMFSRGLYIADSLGIEYIEVIVDQALFCRAMEPKWTFPEFRRIVFRMGGLHIGFCWLDTTGDHMEDIELNEMW